MMSDVEIVQLAYFFLHQHGDKARDVVLQNAKNLEEVGDNDKAEAYLRIVAAIEDLQKQDEHIATGLTLQHRIALRQTEIDDYRARLERSKTELERFKIKADYRNQLNTGMLNAVIAFASAAIRSLMLLNGGAAIAMLAFLGHLAASDLSQTSLRPTQLVPALAAFATGAGLGAITAATAYLSQVSFHELPSRVLKQWIGNAFRAVSIAVVVLGFASFGYGVFQAATVFSNSKFMENPSSPS